MLTRSKLKAKTLLMLVGLLIANETLRGTEATFVPVVVVPLKYVKSPTLNKDSVSAENAFPAKLSEFGGAVVLKGLPQLNLFVPTPVTVGVELLPGSGVPNTPLELPATVTACAAPIAPKVINTAPAATVGKFLKIFTS